MFLNRTPLQYAPRAFYTFDNSLIDNDVNYYGFEKSKEYQEVYDRVLSSPIGTMDIYDSPYFGQGNGAYRELDRVYEAYRARFVGLDDIRQPVTVINLDDIRQPVKKDYTDPAFEMCPPGTMMIDGVCVGVGAPTKSDPDPFNPRSTTSTISPALILAAAAAFFFAG